MRKIIIDQFLMQHGYDPANLNFLAKDMSPRQYHRLDGAERVLMDAPISEKPKEFIQIAEYLKNLGLKAPNVFEHDIDQGLVVLEDFGHQTYTIYLDNNPEKMADLYRLAVDVLLHLHQHATKKPDFIADYSTELLLKEVEVFIDWYWLALFKESPSQTVKNDYMDRWQFVFESMPSMPNTLVLRDYHVDNMMVLDGDHITRCGLLDFQDAVWGSVVYDFISLIEDARRDIPSEMVQDCWNQFTQGLSEKEIKDYKLIADILGAGRHLKVIGVFTRYAIRAGNHEKLCHIPRLWKYLEGNLRQFSLSPIKEWLDEFFPSNHRIIPSI